MGDTFLFTEKLTSLAPLRFGPFFSLWIALRGKNALLLTAVWLQAFLSLILWNPGQSPGWRPGAKPQNVTANAKRQRQ